VYQAKCIQLKDSKHNKLLKIRNMRVTKKEKAKGSFHPLPSRVDLETFFSPLVLFGNAQLKTDQPDEVEELLKECWNQNREVIFDFPDWIYHRRALIPKKKRSIMGYFMTINRTKRDRIYEKGIKKGPQLKALATKEIKELNQFQKELKGKLNFMFNRYQPDLPLQDRASDVASSWFWDKPINTEVKFFPAAEYGYPKKGFPSFLLIFKNFPDYIKYLLVLLISKKEIQRLKQCQQCRNFFFGKTKRESKYCTNECRYDFHNKRRTESGEAKGYMRRMRAKGKYQ